MVGDVPVDCVVGKAVVGFVGDVAVLGCSDVVVVALHGDSSPIAAMANLLVVMTCTLSETPATPVGVPEPGNIRPGEE